MHEQEISPRQARFLLAESIANTPVTLIHGPRQCGKTTLAQRVGEPLSYSYFTFDDTDARAAAQNDPLGFVSDFPNRTILDEVQLVPELFRALKAVGGPSQKTWTVHTDRFNQRAPCAQVG